MNTYFKAIIEDRDNFINIDFNGRCNYIKDIFGDFIAFMNKDKNEKELLLRVIHKNKIVQIINMNIE